MKTEVTLGELAEFLGIDDPSTIARITTREGGAELRVKEFIYDENGVKQKNHRHEPMFKITEIALVR